MDAEGIEMCWYARLTIWNSGLIQIGENPSTADPGKSFKPWQASWHYIYFQHVYLARSTQPPCQGSEFFNNQASKLSLAQLRHSKLSFR